MLTQREITLLADTKRLAATLLEPNAEATDLAGRVPIENLAALADADLVAITTPEAFGGSATSEAFRRQFNETLTAACGTTWFVLIQHLGSCGQLAATSNPSLRERYLAEMAKGQHWVGVGFGHLRRPEPMLRALPAPGGWRVTGTAPWVTGWPILSGVILGAVLPSGRHLYVYADTTPRDGLSASEPLPLCAMNSSATVAVHVDDLFIPEENWIRESSRDEMARGDRRGAPINVTPMLGVATGALRHLQTIAQKRPLPALLDTIRQLSAEIDACRTECARWSDAPVETPGYDAGALAARAWAIELAVRVTHAAVAAASGGANSVSNPAQRRFREAMFYTVFQQTGDIMGATLARLTRDNYPPA